MSGLEFFMVEMAGVEPASCDDIMTTYYTLVPFLFFIVIPVSQWTGSVPTILPEISQMNRKSEFMCQGTADAPFP